MGLDDRWYMHDKDCQCSECEAHKSKANYYITNPNINKKQKILDYKISTKREHPIRRWWHMFFK